LKRDIQKHGFVYDREFLNCECLHKWICLIIKSKLYKVFTLAHAGIIGNERADQLAKSCWSGSTEPVQLDAPFSFAKRHLKLAWRRAWNFDWRAPENREWTKRVFSIVEDRKNAGVFQ